MSRETHQDIDAFNSSLPNQPLGNIKNEEEEFVERDAFSVDNSQVDDRLFADPPSRNNDEFYRIDRDFVPSQHASIFQVCNPFLTRYIGTAMSKYMYFLFFLIGVVILTIISILMIVESLAYGWVAFGFSVCLIPCTGCIFCCSFFFVLRLIMETCISVFHIRDSVDEIARKIK